MKRTKDTRISNKDSIIIYRAKDGTANIEVTLEHETIWLNLKQLTELFGKDKSVISRHIKNIL